MLHAVAVVVVAVVVPSYVVAELVFWVAGHREVGDELVRKLAVAQPDCEADHHGPEFGNLQVPVAFAAVGVPSSFCAVVEGVGPRGKAEKVSLSGIPLPVVFPVQVEESSLVAE